VLSANGLQCLFHIPLIHFPIVRVAISTRLGQQVNNLWNSKMAAKMLEISDNDHIMNFMPIKVAYNVSVTCMSFTVVLKENLVSDTA
jgi:hypothetical protein